VSEILGEVSTEEFHKPPDSSPELKQQVLLVSNWYRSVQFNSSTNSLSSADGDTNAVLFCGEQQ